MRTVTRTRASDACALVRIPLHVPETKHGRREGRSEQEGRGLNGSPQPFFFSLFFPGLE